MKPTELFTLLVGMISARLPVLIKGAPGVGKTDIVRMACQSLGADIIESHPVVSDPADFKGQPWVIPGPNPKEATFLPYGDLAKLIKAKKPTVFFLDDLGQAPFSVQAAAMQLILGRHINGHKIADCVTFVAATNRKQDKAAVTGILEPVKSRFVTIVELTPDLDDWIVWAVGHGIPAELIAFSRWRPELLFKFEPSLDITNSSSPRTVANAAEVLALNLPAHVEYEALCGSVGQSYATELTGFLRVCRQLPDPREVLAHPETSQVPTDPAALYALAGALARAVDEKTARGFFVYASRLGTDFSILMVRDATQRVPAIKECRAHAAWLSKHADVMV